MTDEQLKQLSDEVELASLGKQVVNNKAYINALTLRKAQIFEVFCRTKQDQSDVREEAWRTMKNLTALEDYFNNILTTGKMAAITLESLTETKE